MTEQKERKYWVYLGNTGIAVSHSEQCGRVYPGDAGRSELWSGPYPSRGVAIDAALKTGRRVVEHKTSNCIINPVELSRMKGE